MPEILYFQQLSLLHFRNHADRAISFCAGFNAFCGPNGAGKTNLLEAIHYLCLAKGLHADRDAIMQGEVFFQLEAQLGPAPRQLAIHYLQGRGKRVFWDRVPLPRLVDHVGRLPVVTMLPEDTDLIRLGGTQRRAWLDALLCQADPAYLQALVLYDRALKQRNALLQQQAQGRADAALLELWTEPLLQQGPVLARKRLEMLAAFRPYFEEVYGWVSSGRERPRIAYLDSLRGMAWGDAFRMGLAADLASGRTRQGTHRDDLAFLLNDTPARQFGSQGQQKSFLLALKLAQYLYIERAANQSPILLLDDLLDKLDARRVESLVEILAQRVRGQIFLTHTDAHRIEALLAPTSRKFCLAQLGV
ncbi:MAG: DNA replication and repair protein RecF [Bacteroidetes bacterium]|nr:DNA replication and repair protein RecF [Bacteroidota bacterium]